MDWASIIGAAVGGGIGGALGGLIARLAGRGDKGSGAQTVFILLPALILAGVGREAAKGDVVRDLLRPPSRFERAVRKQQDRLSASSKMRQILSTSGSPEAARQRGEEMAHAGLKRLSAAELDQWNRLRLALADASPVVCAGFWTGRFDKASAVPAALEKLGDADLDAWAGISTTAMLLEVEAEAPWTGEPGALDRALNAILAKLSPADADRLRAAAVAGEAITDVEACWAMHAIMRTASAIDDARAREDVIRAFAAL